MSSDNATPAAPAPVPNAPRRAPVIRLGDTSEDFGERILKRQVPAWVISVAIHAVFLVLFILFDLFIGSKVKKEAVAQDNQEIVTKVEEEEKNQNFENPDIGLDPNLPTNYNIDRIEDVSVAGPLKPDEAVGNNMGDGPQMTLPPPPGLGDTSAGQGGGIDSAIAGVGGLGAAGGMGGPPVMGGFRGRSGATREKMLREGGGNAASEACVARGLIWLSKQQKADGSWEIDGGHKSKIAGTGFALLPFLAAGYTHKGAPKESFNPADKEKRASKYPAQIDAGIKYLISKQQLTGDFGTNNMYEHAIATMALCEAYGMTNDQRLKAPAQLAVRYIVNAQHSGGGWRYAPGQAGDTSVTGWQVQALKSAHLSGLAIPKETLTKSGHYLDSCAGGTTFTGATYGYTGKAGSPSMTAVGLLCRQYLGWGPKNPGLIAGVEELKKIPPKDTKNPADDRVFDVYYYYYATQVVHFYGGPDWHDMWNPRMRDWLLALQVPGLGPNAGSWNPDGTITGSAGGRLVATCLCLLTAEVYYRHLPLYKREASGRDLDGN
jgi:hypothetical protein